ncbi:hypothetical protein C7460_11441 [Marinoscillum furvescens DSM 4134]|uniref:Uncharacterized protein n=2 Tax=Marinoscillum furvescens TaxID=1026 RepID=A0A3D9L0N3_MARFU|nr:hypothetical protein C7460_11441 [Marinoscillum furvescens DSM 4134]
MTLGSIILFTSCNERDEKNDEEINEPLTAEENKKLMQEAGVEFVNEMTTMQQQAGVGAMTSLGVIMDEDDDEPSGGRIQGANSVVRLSKAIVGLAHGKVSTVEFGQASAQLNDEDDDEFTSLEELFNENTGTYDWDASLSDWEYTDNSSTELIFNYPSEHDGTSNNATLTLSNYSSVRVANPIDEEYEGDLPTSLDVSLAVDGSVAMTYGFTVKYGDDGVPTKADTEMTMGDFAIAVGMTNTNSLIGASVSFRNGTKTLIGVSSEAKGDFSDTAIEKADDTEDPTEVLTEANFEFIFMDLKLAGNMDFVPLYNEVADLETSYNSYDTIPRADLEANAETIETALNTHTTLTASYVSTEKKAADVEWYTYIDTWEDGSNKEEDVELGARMVFEDESKVDVEDFLETGFESLESAINNLLDQISEDLDDDIDHIDFDDLD